MEISKRFQYDSGRLLGAGAYGRVYLGFDKIQKKKIAVKVVNK